MKKQNNEHPKLNKESDSDNDVIFSFDRLKKLLLGKEYGTQELKHTVQVYQFADCLLNEQKVSNHLSKKIILISSILHDLGRYIFVDLSRHHTEISADELIPFISKSIRKNSKVLGAIHRCVCHHSLRSKEKPETIEEKIIFDADNLSIFTKFGVVRWFFKAETWGESKNIQNAEQALENIFQKAERGDLFYLPKSKEILKTLFYTTKYRD